MIIDCMSEDLFGPRYSVAGLQSEEKPPLHLWKVFPKETTLHRHSKLFPKDLSTPSGILSMINLKSPEVSAVLESDLELEKNGIELKYWHNNGDHQYSSASYKALHISSIVKEVDPIHADDLVRYEGEELVKYLKRLYNKFSDEQKNDKLFHYNEDLRKTVEYTKGHVVNGCLEFGKAVLSNKANVMTYTVRDKGDFL
jgi:hypothetical protein